MNKPTAISDLAGTAIEYIKQQEPKTPMTLGPNSPVALIVNETLKQLMAIKPAWHRSLKDKGAVAQWKKTWTVAFAQNGIDELYKIEIGIRRAKCDKSPFMPSVGQFIEWCNPAALSDEYIIDAFTRMIERKKPLNDVEHATRLKCGFQCKNYLKHDKALELFSYHIKIFAAKAHRGEYIPSMNTPMLENKAKSQRHDFEQQILQRVPCTRIEAKVQALRLQHRRAK